MAEYIEREAAINLLHYNADEVCSSVVADFEDIPAADVAPVVRCKDCKYHSIIPHTDLYLCRKSYTGCRAEFFCADGERKGDDAELN